MVNVDLADCKGHLKQFRSLCSIGSQVSESLVTEEIIDQSLSTHTKRIGRVSMQSQADEEFKIIANSYIIDAITSMTPATTIDIRPSHHIKGLRLADPAVGIPSPVELLIGVDIWPALVLNDAVVGSHNEPCTLHTRLRWVILGTVESDESQPMLISSFDVTDDSNRDKLLRKFWERTSRQHQGRGGRV